MDATKNEIEDATSLDKFKRSINIGVSMVLFHVVWCEKCEKQRPTIEKISAYEQWMDIRFMEVDYDENRDIFDEYRVVVVVVVFPQILFFKEGVEQVRLIGKGKSKQQITEIIKKSE